MFTSILAVVVSVTSVASASPNPCAFQANEVEYHVQELTNLENYLDRMYEIMDDEQGMVQAAHNHQRIANEIMDEVEQIYSDLGPIATSDELELAHRLEARAEYHQSTADQIFATVMVQPEDINNILTEIDFAERDVDNAVMSLRACEAADGPVN